MVRGCGEMCVEVYGVLIKWTDALMTSNRMEQKTIGLLPVPREASWSYGLWDPHLERDKKNAELPHTRA